MNNSPTEGGVVTPASPVEPTGQEQIQQPSAEVNQETISHEKSQEAVSTDTANQPNTNTQNSGGQNDDGLANFAKSQGFDPDNLTDGERRALKIAHDNQKAYRSANDKKVTDVAQELQPTDANESEDAKFRREFKQYKYEQETNKFWGTEGRDRSLEPSMVEILNEKKAQYGADYARNLSQDLGTLYDLARVRSGNVTGTPVDTEAIRREERESIRQQSTASAGQAHAVSQVTTPQKIDREWLSTHYNPSNPEHRKLVDAAVANGDL